jgi:hypothetical protein
MLHVLANSGHASDVAKIFVGKKVLENYAKSVMTAG